MDAFSFHRKHISGSPSSLEISRKAFPVLCQLFLSLVVNIALDNIAFLLILSKRHEAGEEIDITYWGIMKTRQNETLVP